MPCLCTRYAVLVHALCRALSGVCFRSLGTGFGNVFLLGKGVGLLNPYSCFCGLKINQKANAFQSFVGLNNPRLYVALVYSAQSCQFSQFLESVKLGASVG